ncbi:MAG: hypothetical protein R8M70_04325 [Alphaproteobacteria bacterium]|nr:hypothetical protein [Alphaproteobacteria bacterium]
MKVKNIVFSGFAAAVLMGIAADANAVVQVATKAYVDNLDVPVKGEDGSYIKTVKQDDGFVTATATAFDLAISDQSNDKNAPTSKAVYDFVTTNDSDTTYTGSGYVSIDGNNDITVTNVTDAASGITDTSTALTTGKAVYEYVTNNDSDTTYTGSGYVSIDGNNDITVTNVTDAASGITDGSDALTTANAVYDYVTALTGGVLPTGCDTGDCSLVKRNGTLEWVNLTTPVE